MIHTTIKSMLERLRYEAAIVKITKEGEKSWVDYLFKLQSVPEEWTVYNTNFNTEDVREIIISDDLPNIVLKG